MHNAALGLELKVIHLRSPASNTSARSIAEQQHTAKVFEEHEMQSFQGEKQLELRRYAIPQEFLNQPVYLLQTPDGHEGQSTLPPDGMPAAHPGVCIVGTVTFNGQVVYSSYQQWLADVDKHCVAPGTPYSWQPDVTHKMFGWQVAAVQAAAAPQPVPAMRRVLSSWFEVVEAAAEQHPG